MGKFCLRAFSLSSHFLIACVLLVCLTEVSAQAASNQTSAALHIQVTVNPVVQTTTIQPSATSTTGSVSYSLPLSTAPRMTSQVTVQQISSAANDASQSGKGAVLKTTTVVPE